MYALIKNDLVVGRTTQPQAHNLFVDTNDKLHTLRFDGESIVSVSDIKFTTFYIDERGVKHIAQHDESWQPLVCSFDSELAQYEGSWRIKTTIDEYQEKYSIVERLRKNAYTERVRPYLEEADIKRYQEDDEAYSRLMDMAVAERELIQSEFPWPTE